MSSRIRQFGSLLFLIAILCWCLGRFTRNYHLEVSEEVTAGEIRENEPFETTATTTTTTTSSTTTSTTTTKPATTLNSNFELDYILLNVNVSSMNEGASELLLEFDDRKARLRRVCMFRSSIQHEFNKTEANSTANIIFAIDKLNQLLNSDDEPDEPKCRFLFPPEIDQKTIYHDDSHHFSACFPPETGSAFWLRNYQKTLKRFDMGTIFEKYETKSATNDYVTFITVRNPFDRLLMTYRNLG